MGSNVLSKYIQFLNIKHDWVSNNCYTLIASVYEKFLNDKTLSSYLKEVTDVTDKNIKSWYRNYQVLKLIEREMQSDRWKQVSLENAEEFDLILFRCKKDYISHFGTYIPNNRFLHVEINSYTKIDELTDYWRDRIEGVYRRVV